MRACPQPIIAAIDGVCAGAGAILAMASDLRLGTRAAKVAFLFIRVGLAGCDMGACAMLPRIIGQGRAAELLYTGRVRAAKRPSAGASTTGWWRRRRCWRRRSAWPQPGRRVHLRPRHDQEHAGPGMGDEGRERDRGGGAGPGAVHADGGFPSAPTTPSSRSRSRCSRATGWTSTRLLDWPFFDDGHRRFARALDALGRRALLARRTTTSMLRAGPGGGDRAKQVARGCVPAEHGGLHPRLDVRSLCLAREILAFRDGLADFAFAMQGLGSGPITLYGTRTLQARYLPRVRAGRRSPRSRCRSRTPAPTSRR